MNIVNTMLWMKRNAYENSTIKKVAKLLRHLKRNCNTTSTSQKVREAYSAKKEWARKLIPKSEKETETPEEKLELR